MLEGHKVSQDRKNALMAYFTYWVVAPHVKKKAVTPKKILKPLQEQVVKSREELLEEKEYFKKRIERG